MTKSHSFTERFKRQHDKHVNRDFHSSVQISYDVVKWQIQMVSGFKTQMILLIKPTVWSDICPRFLQFPTCNFN